MTIYVEKCQVRIWIVIFKQEGDSCSESKIWCPAAAPETCSSSAQSSASLSAGAQLAGVSASGQVCEGGLRLDRDRASTSSGSVFQV